MGHLLACAAAQRAYFAHDVVPFAKACGQGLRTQLQEEEGLSCRLFVRLVWQAFPWLLTSSQEAIGSFSSCASLRTSTSSLTLAGGASTQST